MKQQLLLERIKNGPLITDDPLKLMDDIFETSLLNKWIGGGLLESLGICLHEELLLSSNKQGNLVKILTLINEMIPKLPENIEIMLENGFAFNKKTTRSENYPANSIDTLISKVLDAGNISSMKTFLLYNLPSEKSSLMASIIIKSICHTVSMLKFSNNSLFLQQALRLFGEFPLSFCDELSHIFIATILICLENSSKNVLQLLMEPGIMLRVKYMTEINRDKTCPLMKKLKTWFEEKRSMVVFQNLNDIIHKFQSNDIEKALTLLAKNIGNTKKPGIFIHNEIIMSSILSHLEILLANPDVDKNTEKGKKIFLLTFLNMTKHAGDKYMWDDHIYQILIQNIYKLLSHCKNSLKRFTFGMRSVHTSEDQDFEKIEFIVKNILTAVSLCQSMQKLNDSWFTWFNIPKTTEITFFKMNLSFIRDSYLDVLMLNINRKVCELYPQLMPFNERIQLLRDSRNNLNPNMYFEVSRSNLLNDAVETFDTFACEINSHWHFKFKDEIGGGDGSIKEFYSLLCDELMNPEKNLFQGNEAVGLLPNIKSENYELFVFMGKVMAKAILDGNRLGFPFCDEFFTRLCEYPSNSLIRNYNTIIPAFPVAQPLIEQFIIAKKEKDSIMANNALTLEEKNDLVRRLTLNDGSLFDDLFLNFTYPGTGEEMMEGGCDTILSPSNVEKYLDYLYSAKEQIFNSNQLKAIRVGIHTIIPNLLKCIFPHEIKPFISCKIFKKWTLNDLKSSCSIAEFGSDTQAVDFLFEVLTSLNENGQKKFLSFVTGRPYIPHDGTGSLGTTLTIRKIECDNPNRRLPWSSVCVNTLFLPKYTTLKHTKRNLTRAIVDGSGSLHLA